MACSTRCFISFQCMLKKGTEVLPAGSLRCDKFVKSSLASSTVGFIRGGRFVEVLSEASASAVVSIVLLCKGFEVSVLLCASQLP